MKIKSNKTFDCYETAYESWSGGKDITLDGVRLVPVTIFDEIKDEIRNEQNMDYKCHRKTYDNCLRIIDRYRESTEKARVIDEME